MKIAIFIILLSVLFSSCDFKIMEEDLSFQIYKTKKDYSENVPVELSSDRSKIERVSDVYII